MIKPNYDPGLVFKLIFAVGVDIFVLKRIIVRTSHILKTSFEAAVLKRCPRTNNDLTCYENERSPSNVLRDKEKEATSNYLLTLNEDEAIKVKTFTFY